MLTGRARVAARRPTTLLVTAIAVVAAFDLGAEASGSGAAFSMGPFEVRGSDVDTAVLGIGAFDALADDDPTFGANVEYRFGRKAFGIGPALGLDVNADGGLYGYLGLSADVAIGPVVVTPELAAGGYRRGDSLDLGGVFQFRELIDVAYEFENRTRLGVRFAHISNADIHEANPGVEEAFLIYTIPLGPLF